MKHKTREQNPMNVGMLFMQGLLSLHQTVYDQNPFWIAVLC